MPNTNDEATQAIQVDSSVKLPFDTYRLRILDAEYKKSQKDQWMFVLNMEITGFADGRETFRGPGGYTYNVVGVQFPHYVSFSPKAIPNSNTFLKKLGFPTYASAPAEDDVDPTIFGDVELLAILSCKEEKQMKDGDWNDETGTYTKVPMTDENGKQVIAYRININKVVKRLEGAGFNG